eukprot:TRINITY_DN2168_c0_g1_i1.p1 TRINITY_DN2168_c0_g1~~TRINITY_DN2168_c0_g1_i1.p1  ORF type:complete len:297 (-),score=70.87 TRINITY_DN2168_c0_g1_i1:230-1120(-)
MPLVKLVKNSAYYSRFQVKKRRRRQGKTDYKARLRMINQDKNKYNTPKYRFVVRFTNRDVICQVIYATLAGDITICQARAQELPRYGLKVGLTNYASTYCVGLLCARRLLKKFGLDEIYEGKVEVDGEDYNVEEVEDGPRPFVCVLDTGLKRTTTGSKVFAALKGALDGGLDIPHKETRFVGYMAEDKKLDTEMLRNYIFGGHVAEYMNYLEEEDPELYNKQFSTFIEEGVEGDDLEDLYKSVHEAIREDPTFASQAKPKPEGEQKKWKPVKLTLDERKAALKQKLAMLKADEDDE